MTTRSAVGATPPPGRVGAVALAVSSALVITVAGVFDVLAGDRPHHTVTLLLVSGAVGVVRWLLRGRWRTFFVLANLTVVAQPVAQGIGRLSTTPTAGFVPRSPAVPEHLIVLSVQVLVALLVVVVAASEPIVIFVASAALAGAARCSSRCTPPAATSSPACARPNTVVPTNRIDLVVRCRPHRGPPALLGFAG